MKIKTIHLLAIAIITILILGFTRNRMEDFSDVGAIKYSLLPPNTFAKTQQGTWALLDGKPIAEDQLLYTLLEQDFLLDIFKDVNGITKLPDARGNFLRSMNINGQGNDPDKLRPVGSFQPDAFKTHKHTLGDSGRADWKSNELVNRQRVRHDGTGGGISTSFTGDPNETRPKNIAVYCYVKVSN
jgi:hypothetical protein